MILSSFPRLSDESVDVTDTAQLCVGGINVQLEVTEELPPGR